MTPTRLLIRTEILFDTLFMILFGGHFTEINHSAFILRRIKDIAYIYIYISIYISLSHIFSEAQGDSHSRRPFYREVPVSISGHSMWDLWWTKWHWDRFFSEYLVFPLSVSCHQSSLFVTLKLTIGRTSGRIVGNSEQSSALSQCSGLLTLDSRTPLPRAAEGCTGYTYGLRRTGG